MRSVALSYGAPELRRCAQLYWLYGMIISVLIHCVVVVAASLLREAPVKRSGSGGFRVFEPERRIYVPGVISPPPGARAAPRSGARAGIPVPVPEAEPGATVPTQEEMRVEVQPPGEWEGEGVSGGELQLPPAAEDPPPEFVPYEKGPEVVRGVLPVYPELARRAGIEGRVRVKIWVDREGKPRQVVVAESDAEILNEAAVAAAMQFLFTPAIMNDGPVSVWVSLPIRFRLKR